MSSIKYARNHIHALRSHVYRCNPIAESDLAAFMLTCVEDESKWNQILDIGGPDEGMSMKQQAEMIFQVNDFCRYCGFCCSLVIVAVVVIMLMLLSLCLNL